MTTTHPARAGYHHGDLPNALADAATDLARSGGPEAVVLREAARRVGVSAAAAYRHYVGHGELLGAVKQRAIATLADAMSSGLASGEPLADPAGEALRRLRNLGLAYVGFAKFNPGLFQTAFCRSQGSAGPGEVAARIEATRPYQLLSEALGEVAAVGFLDESRLPVAPIAFWAAMHGLATLLVDGPLTGLTDAEQATAVERTLDLLIDGISQHQV